MDNCRYLTDPDRILSHRTIRFPGNGPRAPSKSLVPSSACQARAGFRGLCDDLVFDDFPFLGPVIVQDEDVRTGLSQPASQTPKGRAIPLDSALTPVATREVPGAGTAAAVPAPPVMARQRRSYLRGEERFAWLMAGPSVLVLLAATNRSRGPACPPSPTDGRRRGSRANGRTAGGFN